MKCISPILDIGIYIFIVFLCEFIVLLCMFDILRTIVLYIIIVSHTCGVFICNGKSMAMDTFKKSTEILNYTFIRGLCNFTKEIADKVSKKYKKNRDNYIREKAIEIVKRSSRDVMKDLTITEDIV